MPYLPLPPYLPPYLSHLRAAVRTNKASAAANASGQTYQDEVLRSRGPATPAGLQGFHVHVNHLCVTFLWTLNKALRH